MHYGGRVPPSHVRSNEELDEMVEASTPKAVQGKCDEFEEPTFTTLNSAFASSSSPTRPSRDKAGEGSSMCGVAPFGSSINSLRDNERAASRYREVPFRAEEVDSSSRRGRAHHLKGGWAGGWSEAAAPEGATPGSWNESGGRKPN